MIVALGWRFYSADFSLNASDHSGKTPGTVRLIRDTESRKVWHKLSDAEKEEIPLFVTGRGVDFQCALRDANSIANAVKFWATYEAEKKS